MASAAAILLKGVIVIGDGINMTDKTPLPIPALPKELPYWRQVWNYFRYFLIAAPIGWLAMFVICQVLLAPVYTVYMAVVMSNAIAVVMLMLGAVLGLMSPRQMTWDEHVVRQRLKMARHYYLHEDQLKADAAELEKSCEELTAIKDQKFTDYDVITHTIDRFRQK